MELFSAVLFLSLLLLSCVKSSEGEVSPQLADADMLVTFSPMLTAEKETRAVYPEDAEGGMDDSSLRIFGFGVFAQYAGNTAWTSYTEKSSTPFNFMWNQNVSWDGTSAWIYSPVKYWPNDNNPADDQGATGSQTHSYLNFFAYAPAVQAADLPATGHEDNTADGIIELTANSDYISDSYVYYRTSNEKPFGSEKSVDLLWATKRDCYKTDAAGYGNANGMVNLVFKHALSLFTVTVQGLFDHVNNDDASTIYPDDRDIFSKILIESVNFNGSPVFKEGKMYIAPNPDNADVPHWEIDDTDSNSDGTPDLQQNIIIDGEDVNSTFANRYLDGTWMKYWDESDAVNRLLKETDVDESGAYDAGDALVLYNQLPKGVSHTEVPLNYTNYDTEKGKYEDYWYMILPNDEYRTAHSDKKMKVRMVYYVITYDERLTLVKAGYPMYFSIVKNDVTAVFDSFSFEPNKKYKLRLQPGLTSCKFEVTMVDGWDTPITIDPEVVDWYSTPIEFDVE